MKILLAFNGFDYSQPALDETAAGPSWWGGG